jgi:hypothetical protein
LPDPITLYQDFTGPNCNSEKAGSEENGDQGFRIALVAGLSKFF